MKLQLDEHWKEILRHAWSVRLIVIAGLFAGLECAVPFVQFFLPIPPGPFALLSFVATAGALISRLLAQRDLNASKGN